MTKYPLAHDLMAARADLSETDKAAMVQCFNESVDAMKAFCPRCATPGGFAPVAKQQGGGDKNTDLYKCGQCSIVFGHNPLSGVR